MPRTARPLVTGASAGIGEAFARLLASLGFDLVLVARRAERLEALAAELTAQHGVRCVALPADLADPAAPAQILDTVREHELTVDVLVNNAGFGLRKGFSDASWSDHQGFLQVMAVAPTELCHRCLPGMRARGWGRIVNVASVAAFTPQVPGNLYGGVKRYLVDFSVALAAELAGSGVLVSALCPGYTTSEFHDVIGARDEVDALPGFLVSPAAAIALEGWEAVERGRTVHVNGWINRTIVWVCRHLPPAFLRGLAQRSVLRPRPAAD